MVTKVRRKLYTLMVLKVDEYYVTKYISAFKLFWCIFHGNKQESQVHCASTPSFTINTFHVNVPFLYPLKKQNIHKKNIRKP